MLRISRESTEEVASKKLRVGHAQLHAFQSFPAVWLNQVTQFLGEGDITSFLRTHRRARTIVEAGVRQASVTLDWRTPDIRYPACRDVTVSIPISDGDSEFVSDLITEIRRIFAVLSKLSAAAVHRLTFDWTVGPSCFQDDVTLVTLEAVIMLERMHEYRNVVYLNLENWPVFRAYHKFPALRELVSPWRREFDTLVIPTLEKLVCDEEDSLSDEAGHVLPPGFASIAEVQTCHPIPESYTCLRRATVLDQLDVIPDGIAARLTHLNLRELSSGIEGPPDIVYVGDGMGKDTDYNILSLRRFPRLQLLTLETYVGETGPYRVRIEGRCPVVIKGNIELV